MAFQIVDDVIDIENCEDSGKDCFKDIMEGKFTMPAILAFKDDKFSSSFRKDIDEFISQPVKDNVLAMKLALMIKEGGYTLVARQMAESLIEGLRDEVLSLPCREKSVEFYGFILELCRRRK